MDLFYISNFLCYLKYSVLLAPFYWLLLHPQPLQALCLPAGMDLASTAGSLRMEKCMTKWDLPQHIKRSLSERGFEFVIKDVSTSRINDRGPYIGVRELDLSKGAAQAIGLIDPGVANVEITYL